MEEQVAPQEQTTRPKERPRQGHTHLVQHGDTLASIALKYDMNMKGSSSFLRRDSDDPSIRSC